MSTAVQRKPDVGDYKINFDFTELMKRRVDFNKNNLIVITGETGSGKSMAALDLACRLDPKFDVNQCVFTIPDFLKLVKILEPGQVVVLDEAAIGFDARRSGTNDNVMFSNVLKVFRYKQITTIFTFPNLMMFDKNGRRLMHFHIVMAGINYRLKMASAHCFIVDSHVSWEDEPKRYFPIVNVQGEGLDFSFQVDPVYFNFPPADLRREYEIKKNEFATAMLDEIQQVLERSIKSPKEPEGKEPGFKSPFTERPESNLKNMDYGGNWK